MLFLQDLIEKAEEQPNITLGVIGSIAVIILTALFMILFGGKKPVSLIRGDLFFVLVVNVVTVAKCCFVLCRSRL